MMAEPSTRVLALLVLASACLGAQSISIPPSTAKPGASGSLLLVMTSPAGKGPAALQWKFTFPAGITVDLKDIVAGSAAESAGKTLTCSAGANRSKSAQSFMCILAAGQTAIPNGTICLVRYRVLPSVKWESAAVRVEDVLAVDKDLKKTAMPNLQGQVTTK